MGKVDILSQLIDNEIILNGPYEVIRVRKELDQSFDQTTSNEADEWNIKGDKTDTWPVTLW